MLSSAFRLDGVPSTVRTSKKDLQKSSAVMGSECVYRCSDFVTDTCVLSHLLNSNVVSAIRLGQGDPEQEKAVLLELLFLLVFGRSKSERILAYLAVAEQGEPDVWLRDDYRIAWLTVLYSANGRPSPWDWAFNRVVGGHPAKVIPQLVARAREHVVLGLPPKKSSGSVSASSSSSESIPQQGVK